ncbi:hypothetical protein [Bordetella sp. N]|uniref:XAC2610-related protein n=1 Tax=Bordetella sp. N TaxID=1746199 RepID=UPI000710B65E|nr:hypothetical protein [Bordetella sp. N]ALM83315.1 hypothetical protein ASB57_10350 [Bordetella sp. N]
MSNATSRRRLGAGLDKFRLAANRSSRLIKGLTRTGAAFMLLTLAALAPTAHAAPDAHQTAPAAAKPAASTATVEFPAWAADYQGKIGNRNIRVSLQRVADHVSGNYCYEPCDANKILKLRLDGTWQANGTAMKEYDQSTSGKEHPVTGRWDMRPDGAGWTGTWASPDGKRSLPLTLSVTSGAHAFPYEVRLAADRMPASSGDCATDVPHVTQIRLYNDGQLVQTLPTDSQGTCRIFVPQTDDINFDGWPDLTLGQFLPAGPNIPTSAWIYDPATGKFDDVSAAMENMTSPNFDAANKLIWDFQRGSCCDHYVTIAKWKGKELVQVEQGESFYQPVRIKGQMRYCYVMPTYRNGHVEYPDATWNAGDRLLQRNPADCENEPPDSWDRVHMEVYLRDTRTGEISHEYSEKVQMETTQIKGKTMQCPYVQLLDNGKVDAVSLKDPDYCTATK